MTHAALVRRLNVASVRKHFDAFDDIEWDDPAFRIDPTDPRWELSQADPLGATAWYASQPPDKRARLGLHHTVGQISLGVIFERVLSKGLLNFVDTLPVESPELRYAYHEVIEESQHSLMFAEFVRRSGLEPVTLGRIDRWGSRRVVEMGRRFPELFFIFVLAGEAPIDFQQRSALRDQPNLHPLLRRIMALHVMEEARHLSFAESALRERVPKLGPWAMAALRLRTPIILKTMTEQMLRPPALLVRRYEIPRDVVRAAYGSESHRRDVQRSTARIRELCTQLGLVSRTMKPLWRALGLRSPSLDSRPTPACLSSGQG